MAKRTDIQDGITLMLISRMKSTFYYRIHIIIEYIERFEEYIFKAFLFRRDGKI